jgi:uncharacterized protein
MKNLAHLVTCCVIAMALAGCASSAPTRFYTLCSSAPAPSPPPRGGYAVSVGPVSVPGQVDRRQIVVQNGPNQVSISEFDRWASPLSDEIGRVVTENLITLLGTLQVAQFTQQAAAGAQYRALIDVIRFESEPGKGATLDALWTVSPARGGKPYRGRTTVTETVQGGDYAALVAAHSRALGKLSADMAVKIQEMNARIP